ncbi:MAG: DMT family transporter [Tepidiformaceae bacterium]
METPRYAWLVLLAGVTATSFAAILVRLADESPALTTAAYRMLFAAVIVGGFAVARVLVGADRFPARDAWPWLLLSGLFLAGHFWSWFASLERTSVGSSVVIVAMQPLLAAGLGFLFLRERPTGAEYIGIALAAVGLVIVGGGDLASSASELLGDGLALLGGLLAAAYRTVGRYLRGRTTAAMYSGTVYTFAALALWLLVAAFQTRVGGFGAATWTYLVLLAIGPQVIGHTAFNWGVRHFRVVTVSIVAMLEPVGATVLAIFILDEDPSVPLLLGAPFILAGVAVGLGLATFREPRRPGELASG